MSAIVQFGRNFWQWVRHPVASWRELWRVSTWPFRTAMLAAVSAYVALVVYAAKP